MKTLLIPMTSFAILVAILSTMPLSAQENPAAKPTGEDNPPVVTPIKGGYFIEWSTLTGVGGFELTGPLKGRFEIQFDLRKEDVGKPPRKPTSSEILLPLADYWIMRNNPSRAIPIYRRGLQEEPNNILFQNNLALLLSRVEGNHGGALELIDKALVDQHDNVTLLDTKGLILMNADRSDEAIPVLDRAVELSCQHPLYCMHLAKACDMTGDTQRCQNWFDKARPLLQSSPGKLTKENREMFEELNRKYPTAGGL